MRERNMIFLESHRLLFCPIPKVACSNWLVTFRKASGLVDVDCDLHDRKTNGLVYLSNLPNGRRKEILSDPKIMRAVFVRNPWTRILSAYRDKILRPRRKRYIQATIRTARWLSIALGRRISGDRISFEEFITLLEYSPTILWNEHWQPQTSIAGLGRVRYDFVGRFEKLLDDAAELTKRAGLPPFHSNQENLVYATASDHKDILRSYYTPSLIERVGKLYMQDVKLLAYGPPDAG